MTALQMAASLIVLAGIFGSINYLLLRLPATIGILIVALLVSLTVLVIDLVFPGLGLTGDIRRIVDSIDFSSTLLEWMLGLLLFAGALRINLSDLRRQWAVVLVMATLGVALSAAIVGAGFWLISGMPLLVALVFGALISPTDPVAVLGVLGSTSLPEEFKTQIAGESLFNDGVGYALYLVVVSLAFPSEAHGDSGFGPAALRLLWEALGGVVLGLGLGWLVFRLLRRIDEASLEVLLTLGLALGGYEMALAIGVSGPISAVCAGLLIGDVGTRRGMSERTRGHVEAFWMLVDENPQRGPVSADRDRGLRAQLRGEPDRDGRGGAAAGSAGPLRGGGDPDRAAAAVSLLRLRRDADHDLGRAQGRYLGRPRAVAAGQRLDLDHPERDLSDRDLLGRRPGAHDRPRRGASGPAKRLASLHSRVGDVSLAAARSNASAYSIGGAVTAASFGRRSRSASGIASIVTIIISLKSSM